MKTIPLGHSDLHVTPICLGTMTFGEQVAEADAHAILSRSLERGVNFVDTAEMYSVPARAETYGATETILGHWFMKNPGARHKVVLATKVAGPSRGMGWIRNGSPDLTGAEIIDACHGSLHRLHTDVIDLYQIHWPVRHVPAFGGIYFDPMDTTFFASRETIVASANRGMPIWRDKLFAFMHRNAAPATGFFRIPGNRLVELGAQVEI